MSCERLGARRWGISQTHWCCASAYLQNNASRFTLRHTHSLHKTVDSGMQQAGAEELGGTWYQPSLLFTHVASYNNMTWSILAPPRSPLRNMAEITAGASTFWLCLGLTPSISGCCQYFVSVYSVPRLTKDMLLKCALNILTTPPCTRGLALQKSTTLAVSFARSILDSVVGNVLTFVSIAAMLRRRIISKANLFWPISLRMNHKHACGVHLRHPIGTRSLCLFAAPCHHSSRSPCPGAACARSLRAGHHQFIAKARVIRLRTCHPGVRLSVLQLMQLLLVCSSSNAIKTDQNCLGFQKTFFMSFWGLDDMKQLHRPLSALNMVVRGMFISFKPK